METLSMSGTQRLEADTACQHLIQRKGAQLAGTYLWGWRQHRLPPTLSFQQLRRPQFVPTGDLVQETAD
ncbi:hypothetical protein Taro_018089 [Colocasia esculenta]|uniref:Uncharacterized protein n=1 Tax=Colocasia esculenta TaxID=4460 RepID=A0A843V1D6_COLES|nr:hypothetical protein [Colocasia esculenta]